MSRFRLNPWMLNITRSICIFLILFVSSGAYTQQQYLINRCGKREGTCREKECVCKDWIIELRSTRHGGVWGIIREETLEKARRRLQESQENDERLGQWMFRNAGIDPNTRGLSYRNPSEPMCNVECGSSSTGSSSSASPQRGKAELLLSEWEGKLEGAIEKFIVADEPLLKWMTGGETNATTVRNVMRGSKVGGVVKDYARALTDAQLKLRQLEAALLRPGTNMGLGGIGEINIALDAAISDLERSLREMQRAYNSIPKDAQTILETGRADEDNKTKRSGTCNCPELCAEYQAYVKKYCQDVRPGEISLCDPASAQSRIFAGCKVKCSCK